MAQILSLAQSLGLQPPAAAPPQTSAAGADFNSRPPSPAPSASPAAAKSAPSSPAVPPELTGLPDARMMQSMLRLLQQSQHTDGKQEALFCALKPYLAPEKREKLDRALQMAKLSRLAGFALKNYGTVADKGGK